MIELIEIIIAITVILFFILWFTMGINKALKFTILPIMIPLSFLVTGIIGMIAFVILLFDNKRRNNLFEMKWPKK